MDRHEDPATIASETRDFLLLREEASAKRVMTRGQFAVFLVLFAAIIAFAGVSPQYAILALSILFSLFYISVILFRSVVLAAIDRLGRDQWLPVPRLVDFSLPDGRYVILSALYREADQVADLVESLERLRWHVHRRMIVLVCEEGDGETIAVIERMLPRPGLRLLVVPAGSPRTKPRALSYALRHVEGEYLVVYDAEDRPYPDQLIEAARRFEAGSDRLACLQSPLMIDNVAASWLARLFAIEYDTLFRGILPTLARWGAPIPLGGTSNHFRLPLLIEAGGWDSYNVTEDADLGIRLARRGFSCGTLICPTLEEAPSRLGPWTFQRTRWLKGWMQTLLVHLRQPLVTAREMGWRNFLLFQIILTSLVVSVLVHPLFLIAYGYQMALLASGAKIGTLALIIMGISNFNLAAGYLIYGSLAYAVETRLRRREYLSLGMAGALLLTPIYWMLISWAGWRALFQLIRDPHVWEKTPHGCSHRTRPWWMSKKPGRTPT
ncbi:MAG: glycosyltransferase [Nitratireductor sp.]|nr:glycosyltransferase [Nitratireductor sp.]